MQRRVVLVARARAGFCMASQDAIDKSDPHLNPDRAAIHVPSAYETNFQPVMRGTLIAEQPVCRNQVQIPVVVVVCPSGLVRPGQQGQSRLLCRIDESPPPVVTIQDRAVFYASTAPT